MVVPFATILIEILIRLYISVTNNSKNSYDSMDSVKLNLYSKKVNCLSPPTEVFAATPRKATCRVTTHALPLSFQNHAIDGCVYIS